MKVNRISNIIFLILLTFPSLALAAERGGSSVRGLAGFIEGRLGAFVMAALLIAGWSFMNKNANRGLGLCCFALLLVLGSFRICVKIFDL